VRLTHFILVGVLISGSLFLAGCAKASDPVEVEQKNILTVNKVYQTVGIPHDLLVTETKIFVAEDQAGFSIFNRESGTLITRENGFYPEGPENPFNNFQNVRQLGYIASTQTLVVFDRYGPAQMHVYDLTDINNPEWVAYMIGDGMFRVQYFDADSDDEGNIVLAISNSNSAFRYGTPEEFEGSFFTQGIPTYYMPNAVEQFHIVDNHVYLAAAQRGLYIFDLETRSLVSELNMTGEALDVKVKGDYAYVVAKQEGLLVADISDKANPVWLVNSTRSTSGWAQSIDVEGDNLVVGSGGGGVYLYDIGENPAEPKFLDRIDSDIVDYTLFVAIENNEIFVAGRYLGISQININR
jgi:hypothetical protein